MNEFIKMLKKCKIKINERENGIRAGTDDGLERKIFHFHIVQRF